MVIGLVGGLGVGAAVHYYRELATRCEQRGQPLELVMVHALMSRIFEHASTNDRAGLAAYLAGLLAQMKAAGATIGVIPALTPHICIDELQRIAPMPVIDIVGAVDAAIRERRLSRVALFGTRFVVESDMFGRLRSVEVVRPRPDEVEFIDEAYSQLARTGSASAETRQKLVALAKALQTRDRAEAIVLAGTDLALLFDDSNTPFPCVDCARVHIDAIMQVDAGASFEGDDRRA